MNEKKMNENKIMGKDVKTRIVLEMHGERHICELIYDDYTADELIEEFTRLLVMASFSPSVIKLSDGGHYECEYKMEGEK